MKHHLLITYMIQIFPCVKFDLFKNVLHTTATLYFLNSLRILQAVVTYTNLSSTQIHIEIDLVLIRHTRSCNV